MNLSPRKKTQTSAGHTRSLPLRSGYQLYSKEEQKKFTENSKWSYSHKDASRRLNVAVADLMRMEVYCRHLLRTKSSYLAEAGKEEDPDYWPKEGEEIEYWMFTFQTTAAKSQLFFVTYSMMLKFPEHFMPLAENDKPLAMKKDLGREIPNPHKDNEGESDTYWPLNLAARQMLLEKMVLHWAREMQKFECWRKQETEHEGIGATTYQLAADESKSVPGQRKKKSQWTEPARRVLYCTYKKTRKTALALSMMLSECVKDGVKVFLDKKEGLGFAEVELFVAEIKNHWGLDAGLVWHLQYVHKSNGETKMYEVKSSKDLVKALMTDEEMGVHAQHMFKVVDGPASEAEGLLQFPYEEEEGGA
ncbi:hypothetical protein CKM354_001270200 [Cercospora kikuchii]|uniref:Uncharacterized protein n=1 Tax=Cercospora kikuchii TaxID=84275 RepID=A0A9P3L1L7_9PEZI|nr:uncharacterized protein CKM354_001270200 [Cercospora kikuchii]GIZ49674.1 hypothetical protein CKM354_001270200 [Cercospora kikuchii]